MPRVLPLLVGCAVLAVACDGSPTEPTRSASAARIARLSRTRFMAFGDSWTTGEITAPIGIGTGPITKLVVVPAASYPSQLQMLLVARYSSQMPLLLTGNAIFEF